MGAADARAAASRRGGFSAGGPVHRGVHRRRARPPGVLHLPKHGSPLLRRHARRQDDDVGARPRPRRTGPRGARGRQHGRGARHHARDRAGGRARNPRLRPQQLPRAPAGVASLALLDLSTQEFLKGLKLFYRFKDTWFGLFKSATFGFTITLVGCLVGLNTRGGAEGVGLSTTRAVVYSAVLLLVLDAFWALVLLR
ncbi:MAG: hypothetical protein DMD67_10360 [Gemmatimonadetes bacterium]|nr:MAG: hypothetical protein DMD67_10360 [Gemmatimonadota bacterium]